MPRIIVRTKTGMEKVMMNPSLSLKAKGLFCTLVNYGNEINEKHQEVKARAKAEYYYEHPTEIHNQAEQNWIRMATTDGEQSIRSAIKELRVAGHLEKTRTRTGGKFSQSIWVLK